MSDSLELAFSSAPDGHQGPGTGLGARPGFPAAGGTSQEPNPQILTSYRGGWVNLPPAVAWRVRAGGSPTLGPDATCKHPPPRGGRSVPYKPELPPPQALAPTAFFLLLPSPSFSEGRKPPSVMVMPPPCPRNLKNNLFPLHFHAPPVLPCRQPTF